MAHNETSDFTKRCITDALFYLMQHKPYEKITITEIAQRAGVGRVTYYRHFSSKDDIIDQYFRMQARDKRALFHTLPRTQDDCYEIIFSLFTQLKEKKRLMQLIQQAHLEHLYLQFLNEAMVENFQRHQKKSSGYAPYYYAGCLFNISMEWVRRDCCDSVKQVADEYAACLLGTLEKASVCK